MRHNVTKPVRDAAIYAALSTGAETHEAIARRLNVSRQTVSRCAVEHRADLDAEAAKTKQAAIAGPVRARALAEESTPEAIEYARGVMNGTEDLSDVAVVNVRLAAAKMLLDRGGVPARADLSHTVDVTPEKLERVMAMARLLAS
jgi:transposase-like protein